MSQSTFPTLFLPIFHPYSAFFTVPQTASCYSLQALTCPHVSIPFTFSSSFLKIQIFLPLNLHVLGQLLGKLLFYCYCFLLRSLSLPLTRNQKTDVPGLASHRSPTSLVMVIGLVRIQPVQSESLSNIYLTVLTKKLFIFPGTQNKKHMNLGQTVLIFSIR